MITDHLRTLVWPLWYGTDPEMLGIRTEISPAQRDNVLLQYLPGSYTERHFAGCQPERRWQNQPSAAFLCEKRSLCTAPHFRKLILATSCKVFKVIAKCQALDACQNAQKVWASLHLPGSPGGKRRAEIGCSCPRFLGMAKLGQSRANKRWNNELLSSCHFFLLACPSFYSCKIQELKRKSQHMSIWDNGSSPQPREHRKAFLPPLLSQPKGGVSWAARGARGSSLIL